MQRSKNILEKSESDIEKVKRKMLEAATNTYGFVAICKKAGISPIDGRLLLGADSNLAYEIQEMRDLAIDQLEQSVYERAMGIETPVYNKDGDLTGMRTVYSDQLAKMILQGLKPHKYGTGKQSGGEGSLHDQFIAEIEYDAIDAEFQEV